MTIDYEALEIYFAVVCVWDGVPGDILYPLQRTKQEAIKRADWLNEQLAPGATIRYIVLRVAV